MPLIDPTQKLTLSAYHWNKLYNLADNTLHHATLKDDSVVVEAMTALMVELDNIMYGGRTSYDDPDQLELDFGTDEEDRL